MKRRTLRTAWLVAVLTAVGAVAVRTPSPAAPSPKPEPLPGPVQIDTPPPLELAAGWPFEELPLVKKFAVPIPDLALVSRPYVFELALITPPPGPPAAPALAQASPLWLLPLPVAAAGFGRERVSVIVVSEPSPLPLLWTGLLLLGLLAMGRQRAARSPP
jgi:hypothetical protein